MNVRERVMRVLCCLLMMMIATSGVPQALAQDADAARPVSQGTTVIESERESEREGEQRQTATQTPPPTQPTGQADPTAAPAAGQTTPDATVAPGGDKPSGPTDATVQSLRVIVTGVQGLVQVRTSEEAPWQPAKTGMEVGVGAEFRTNLRSFVRLEIPPGQTITLSRLGTMSVLEAIQREEGKFKTDVGLKYGRVRYEVEAASGEHQSTIRSPGSTLAIRGTITDYEDRVDQMPVMVMVENGTAAFRNRKGSQVLVGHKGRTTRMSDEDKSPTDAAKREGRLNPRGDFAGQTDTELAVLSSQPVIAGDLLRAQGVEGFQQAARQEVMDRGFMDPVVDPPDMGDGFPGDLDPSEFGLAFVTTWEGMGDRGSNVDLTIRSPVEEPLLKANNETVPSGGQHFGDFVATSSTGFTGAEFAVWFTQNAPRGIYDLILDLNNLPAGGVSDPVSFEVLVFSVDPERGVLQDNPFSGSLTPASPRQVIPIDTRDLGGFSGYYDEAGQ